MRAYSDLAPISMTDDERRSARARGLTREWELDWGDLDSDTHFLRDKKCLAATLTWATITSCASLCPPSFVRLRNCGCNSLGSGVSGWEAERRYNTNPPINHIQHHPSPTLPLGTTVENKRWNWLEWAGNWAYLFAASFSGKWTNQSYHSPLCESAVSSRGQTSRTPQGSVQQDGHQQHGL
ncbi:hypothetical protein THAOC_14866 [Thalassiosira oceanica]|uniref:Uncharacterized protein n=1 Tax=Thalassiosira oceanica TaxID=159749 RepID=K0SGB4_THAOC|nr:hypothetical protein THAOC_14866 [Thalassiosira oceanica]|eukprot:EJK64400.1 hypothetical protein THAOC_14866 [Thalassiosira oceanica]